MNNAGVVYGRLAQCSEESLHSRTYKIYDFITM